MNDALLYRIKNQYNQVDELLRGLSEELIHQRHNPEKWSIKENLAHLGRYQEIYNKRINTILKEEIPVFDRYKAESDVLFESWIALTMEEIVSQTKKERKLIFERLSHTNQTEKHKSGIHPRLGNMNISEWTEFFLLHEAHHFYTIFWLVKEYSGR